MSDRFLDPPFHPALLPAGLRDLLPPDAETEAAAVEAMMESFAAHGYERIKPPLIEFEDGLLAGSGAGMADQTFRLMDPDTHRMMGVRADMTPQIARIATTRLGAAPRPLRLSYAGQCLRVRGSHVDPNRQIAQAGIELIGDDSVASDVEMVLMGVQALLAVGLSQVSFDLTLPRLAMTLLDEAGVSDATRQKLLRAMDRKDVAAVTEHGGALAQTLTTLLLTAGAAGPALEQLEAVTLPPESAALCARLAATARALRIRAPELRLTIDPLEFRGQPYHTGVCTTVYALGQHEMLGRGGRYLSGDEPATGLTLYPDAVLRACAAPTPRPRVLVTLDADLAAAADLRKTGHVTVAALGPVDDAVAEAKRLHCTYVLHSRDLQPI
jgi:ATP phosphoribosyltransferase regulatory subunit